MKLAKGTILVDRYEILELVGSGGMALVYKAKDNKLGRVVAIKTLREEYIADNEFLSRFSSEARAAASLANANIVNAYDVGTQDDVHFIVMEYVDGVTLKELIVKRAPFGNEETLGIAIQIANALSHAHKNGIIHRDIKPQNIIVTKSGVVKVTDFGIARNADAQTTTSGGAMGSVHYFSPEQARGRFVDFGSDIYSLGIVMFEMAGGTLPFDGDTAVAVALKHINEPLPDIREINPEVSMSVYKILRKAAAKTSSQRYKSVDEMLVDLKKAMTDESGGFVAEAIELIGTRKMVAKELEQINNMGDDDDDEYDDEDFDEYDDDDDDDDEYDDESDDELDKRAERRIIIAAICTGIAIIVLVTSIGLWLYRGRGEAGAPSGGVVAGQPTEVVPALGNMSVDEAREALENMGLLIGSIEMVYNEDVEEGRIIDQYPAEGDDIEEGGEVSLVVSRGTGLALVPDATGLLFTTAVTMPEFANNIFLYSETEVFDDDLPVGVIVVQYPPAGSMAMRGSTITFEVSRGREIRSVAVPNLLGDTEEVAMRKLEDAGLRIGQITSAYSADFPEGQVFMQNFNEGDEVTEGTVVTFIVSRGARPGPATPDNQPPSENQPPPPPPENEPPVIPVRTETVVVPSPTDALALGPVQVHIDIVSGGSAERAFEQAGMLSGNFPLIVTVSGPQSFEARIYVNGRFESSRFFD